VPVILGNSIHCLKLSKAMLARGVNVQPILHPAVEEIASRLRYFITTRHSEQQIRYTVGAMVEELERIDPRHLVRARNGADVAS
jgi:8-amino-7-oxononanoate synthase